jgi:aconitate hydratase
MYGRPHVPYFYVMTNTFGAQSTLKVGNRTLEIYRLDALTRAGFDVQRLPYSLRILLENLLRTEDGVIVTPEDVQALAGWMPGSPPREIAFTPARVLLQDFTGVPAVVDLAAMRDAMAELGGEPGRINPLQPVELVVDHSVQVDAFGSPQAFQTNVDLALGPTRVRELSGGSSEYRNCPPGESGISGPRGVQLGRKPRSASR